MSALHLVGPLYTILNAMFRSPPPKDRRMNQSPGKSSSLPVEFTRKDLRDEGKVKDLIEQIQAAGSG